MAELFAINHETGNLTQWTAAVSEAMSAVTPGLAGTNYAASKTMNANVGYLRKDFTWTTGVLRIRLYMDQNTTASASGSIYPRVLNIFNETQGLLVVDMLWRTINGFAQQRPSFRGYNDASGFYATAEQAVTVGPHYYELRLTRAATNSSADGSASVFLDGEASATYATGAIIDNFDRMLPTDTYSLRVGIAGSGDANLSGTFLFDEIVAVDTDTVIGGLPSTRSVSVAVAAQRLGLDVGLHF